MKIREWRGRLKSFLQTIFLFLIQITSLFVLWFWFHRSTAQGVPTKLLRTSYERSAALTLKWHFFSELMLLDLPHPKLSRQLPLAPTWSRPWTTQTATNASLIKMFYELHHRNLMWTTNRSLSYMLLTHHDWDKKCPSFSRRHFEMKMSQFWLYFTKLCTQGFN